MDEFAHCCTCARVPLLGESVTVMREGERESAVCDLCLDRPRSNVLGEPVRRERVRSIAGAANVRRAWEHPATAPARAPVAA